MKSMRQHKIKEIIVNRVIETQEDLAEALREQGIEVTQATVSRDIKELRLVKTPSGNETYRYSLPQEPLLAYNRERMHRMFRDSVTKLDYSENIVTIKTLPGTANAVASTIDGASWPEIIGTVAGDDCILIVVKPKEAAPVLLEKLSSLLG